MNQFLRVRKKLEPEHYKEKTNSPIVLPFPHAMTNQRKVNHDSKIFKIFKEVKINIPLLDVIKQVLFLMQFFKKELCTVKKKSNVKKKAEKVSFFKTIIL